MAGGSAQPDGHGRLKDISVKKAGFRLSMVPPGHGAMATWPGSAGDSRGPALRAALLSRCSEVAG